MRMYLWRDLMTPDVHYTRLQPTEGVYSGQVVQVTFDYDESCTDEPQKHLWADGADAPQPMRCMGADPADENHHRAFGSEAACRKAGFTILPSPFPQIETVFE